MPVKFTTNKMDCALINKIVKRFAPEDKLGCTMDISAVHSSGCPLNLRKLLAADDATFGHDMNGIMRYINRNTGELTNHFLPRCANHQ